MHIIAIASGKGGVGKSLISANLAIVLAQSSKKVVLADFDLGGSNLHLLLGEQAPARGVGSFLSSADISLEEITYPTGWENLFFIPGEAELPGMANVPFSQKTRLIRAFHRLNADYLILDLGAGTNFNTVDLFLSASRGVVVTVPTPTSIMNAYLFLKNAAFRVLRRSYSRNSPVYEFIEGLRKDGISLQKTRLMSLMETIRELDSSVCEAYTQRISLLRPQIIMNMLGSPEEVIKGSSRLRISVREYLGMELECLGVIFRDYLQEAAQTSGLPIVSYKPKSVLSRAVTRIAKRIMDLDSLPELPSPEEFAGESFEASEAEAHSDFKLREEQMSALLHSGVLSHSTLVETVQSQQVEILSLKRESRRLKKKLLDSFGSPSSS